MTEFGKISKFDVLETIGDSAFAIVYRGRDPFVKREVAIKICVVPDEHLRASFLKEAERSSGLNHKSIVRILEFGSGDAKPYLVEEFLTGEDLRVKIATDSLDLVTRLDFLQQVAHALHYAHGRGVLHGDVRAGVVRLTGGERVKLWGFGISRLARAAAGLSLAPEAPAPDGCFPPELALGLPADPRTDIFAFGALAYELLSGQRPYPGTTFREQLRQPLESTPPSLEEVLPDCPPRLARVVARCLKKNPGERYPELEPITTDLAPILEQVRWQERRQLRRDADADVLEGTAAPPPSAETWPSRPQEAPRSSLDDTLAVAMDFQVPTELPEEAEEEKDPDTAYILEPPVTATAESPAAPEPAQRTTGDGGGRPGPRRVAPAAGNRGGSPAGDGGARPAAPVQTERAPEPAAPATRPSVPLRARLDEVAASLAAPAARAFHSLGGHLRELRERNPLRGPLRGRGKTATPGRVAAATRVGTTAAGVLEVGAAPATAPAEVVAPPAPQTGAPEAPEPITRIVEPDEAEPVTRVTEPTAEDQEPVTRVVAPGELPQPAREGAAASGPPGVGRDGAQGRRTAGGPARAPRQRRAPKQREASNQRQANRPVARARIAGLKAARSRAVRWTAAAVLATVTVGALAWWSARSPSEAQAPEPAPQPVEAPAAPPEPPPQGMLIVDATPWARVAAIVAADGRRMPLPASPFTPLAVELPPGTYQVHLEHPDAEEPHTCETEVTLGGTARCRAELGRVEAVEYFKEIGWWR